MSLPGVEIVSADAITPQTMPTPTAPVSSAAVAPAQPAPPSPALDSSKVDSKGTVFDPTKHIDRTNPSTGRWMPRGGRKARVIPTGGPAPAPAEKPAPSFIPQSVPPAPKVEGEQETPSATQPTAAALPDNSEDAAECAARALQFAAGTVFDDHDASTPAPKEHASMVRSFAAFIRAKGWQATAGVAVVIVLVAWLLRVLQKDKPREKVRHWLGLARVEKARDVTPEEKKPAAPAPTPVAVARPQTIHDIINLESE